MGKVWPTSDELVRAWSRDHPEVLLAFSGGKDAVAAWLHMRPHFRKIAPVYYYLVPDLGFVERGLRYFEEWFGTPIIRMPHPSLYRMLARRVFQSPEDWRFAVLGETTFPKPDYDDLRRDAGFQGLGVTGDDDWIAVGTRACDSPHRRMAFNKWGPVKRKTFQFYPVWDWNKARVVETIAAAGVKLPAEYRVFGRSFDGIDFRFLHGIRKQWPDDYEKILHWFPLAELELKRYEFKLAREARRAQE